MRNLLIIISFIFIWACQPAQDNEDGSDDNLKFSLDQLGRIELNTQSLQFGPTLIGNTKNRIIQVSNVGKLPVRDFKTLFDGEEFNGDFAYAGDQGAFPGVGGTCPEQLESGDSCTISFAFLPLTQGDRDIEVELSYANGLSTSKIKINLLGYGGSEASVVASETLVDFSFLDQSGSARRELTLTNAGQQIARDLEFDFNQTQDALSRDLFSIDAVASTCPLAGGTLGIGQSCSVVFDFAANSDQDYQTYVAKLDFAYKYDPDIEDLIAEEVDLQALVVSIEGVLSVPTATLNFSDFVNGAITSRNIALQNTGYNILSIDSVQIVGSEGAVSIDTTDCLNSDDEVFDNIGRLTIAPANICVLQLLFAPNVAILPGDFSSSQIDFRYENYKTGIVTSDSFAVDAILRSPSNLIIQGATLPNNETWNITNAFLSNNADFTQEASYTIENVGDVVATGIELNYSGNPYILQDSDCDPIMAAGDTCTVSFTMTPANSIYVSTNSLDLSSALSINYDNQTDTALSTPSIVTTTIDSIGVVELRSDLIFLDSSEATNVSAVAGHSSFFTMQVQNQGGVLENNFSLLISDPTRFFVLTGAGYATVNGEQNCGDIDNGAGQLGIDDTCSYAIRVFETVAGNYTSDLTLDFNASANQSDIVTASATFGDPGKIELLNPDQEDKVAVRTYSNFNYPGVGTMTPVGDVSLQRIVSTANLALPVADMTFPTPPVAMTVDFALIEAGYYPIGASHEIELDFSNTGGFEIELRNFVITQVRNETLDIALPVDGSVFDISNSQGLDCFNGSNIDTINAASNCNMRFEFTPATDAHVYSGIIQIDYTLGERVSPTSEDLVVYTSYINLLGAGYDPAAYANVEPVAPVSIVTDGTLEYNVVFGVGDSDSQSVTFENTSVGVATNLQIAVEGSSSAWTTTSGAPLVLNDLTQLVAPLDNYYEINNSSCSVAVAGQVAPGETCILAGDFTPTSQDDIELTIHYRFFNGITYERNSFTLEANSNTPANIFLRGIDGSSPLYTYDFGIEVVESVTTQKIEFVNQGEATASNIIANAISSDFTFAPSVDPMFPGCGVTLDAGDSCFYDLNFEPQNAGVETNLQGIFNVTFDNGLNPLLALGSESISFDIQADGFSEEKYSLHQGWTQVEAYGDNEAYAISEGVDAIDVGYVRLAWNHMIDDGVIANPIDRYIIFKNQTNVFDIHNDTPYAFVIPGGGDPEVEFIDNNLANIPGSVWFYYIIAERAGRKSRVDLETSNIATIRIAIPYNYSSLLHKYQASMDQCRLMNLDVNDVNNINLENNGCRYTDQNFQILTHAPNYDLHVDKYEATLAYSQTAVATNLPGDRVIQDTYENGFAACSAKSVSFTTTAPGLTDSLNKTFMTKQEHFIVSQPSSSAPYTTLDCQTNDFERLSGAGAGICDSKYQLEYAVGGYPEWTSSGISGFGIGNSTNDITQGVDFTQSFDNLQLGVNDRNFITASEDITELCMDSRFGIPVSRVFGQCVGDNLKNIVFSDGAIPEDEVNVSQVAQNTRFLTVYFNQDISNQTVEVKAIAGGGDLLDVGFSNNYSPYTTEFYTTNYPFATYRCVTRLPYID